MQKRLQLEEHQLRFKRETEQEKFRLEREAEQEKLCLKLSAQEKEFCLMLQREDQQSIFRQQLEREHIHIQVESAETEAELSFESTIDVVNNDCARICVKDKIENDRFAHKVQASDNAENDFNDTVITVLASSIEYL